MRGLVLRACALRFLDAFLLIAPFYTVMFAERGIAAAQVGVILAAWSITGLVLQIPFGVLADHVPRRWLIATGQIVRAVGLAIWIVFPSFWGFLVGLVLWGAKSASMSGIFEALVYDELKAMGREGEYARVIGRTQAARFGGVVAASLAAAVAAPLGFDALTAASIAAGFLAAGAALLLPSAPRAVAAGRPDFLAHLRRGALGAVRTPGVLPALLFIAAIQAVWSACADYWQLFGRGVGLPASAIAIFIAGLSATEALASILAHRTRGAAPGLSYGLLVAAGLAIVAAAATFQAWSVLLVVAALGLYRVVDVNAEARFQQAVPDGTRATVGSVKGFAVQGAAAVLMLAFGVLAQASDYRTAFLGYGMTMAAVGAGFALAGGAAALAFRTPPAPRRR